MEIYVTCDIESVLNIKRVQTNNIRFETSLGMRVYAASTIARTRRTVIGVCAYRARASRDEGPLKPYATYVRRAGCVLNIKGEMVQLPGRVQVATVLLAPG